MGRFTFKLPEEELCQIHYELHNLLPLSLQLWDKYEEDKDSID